VLKEFGAIDTESRGYGPAGPLAWDGTSKFYGVTESGGRFGSGTVFRVALDGTMETLVDFSGPTGAAHGQHPDGGLVLASDGYFYGLTLRTGSEGNDDAGGNGTVFRVSAQGTFASLVTFTGKSGAFPGRCDQHNYTIQRTSPMLALPDGSLVGVTQFGGKFDLGTVFRISAAGEFKSVIAFGSAAPGPGTLPGAVPFGTMVRSTIDGTIYGLAYDSVSQDQSQPLKANIWQLPASGAPSLFVDLDNDSGSNPIENPIGGLVLTASNDLLVAMDSDNVTGGLYTITPGVGTITKLGGFPTFTNTLGQFSDIGFALNSDGAGGYLGAQFGTLYASTPAGVITELAGPNPDAGSGLGISPQSHVLFDAANTLYVLNAEGGANGKGTIVKQPNFGAVSLLAAMPADLSTHFDEPQFLAADNSGNLLLADRGDNSSSNGRILQIDPSGSITTRADFSVFQSATNIVSPNAGLAADGLGNFYGTANMIDPANMNGPDFRALYRLTAANGIEALTHFDKTSFFEGPLVKTDATHFVGVLDHDQGVNGEVFRLDAATGLVDKIHIFTENNPTGIEEPTGPVLVEPGGAGTSLLLARIAGVGGAIVRLSATLQPSRVAVAPGHGLNSGDQTGPLAQDAQGRIYGITSFGGSGGGGVLFRVELDGTFRELYDFRIDASADAAGFEPVGGLTLGSDGAIYGATARGGPDGGGTIFKVFSDPDTTGNSQPAANLAAHSVTLAGQITDNGFSGEYWFTYGVTGGALNQETAHQVFDGFHGMQNFTQAIAGLQGHHDYDFKFHASVGLDGSEALIGTTLSFTTPNGAPKAQNDNILVGPEGEAVTGDVLRNDSDLPGTFVDSDGDPLDIDSFTQGTYGDVTQVGNKLVYTPRTAEFFDPLLGNGKDSFTYTVTDNYPDATAALKSTAIVNVLFDSTIVGEYAGLLFETTPAAAIIPAGAAAAPPANPLAAGFVKFVLTGKRQFTARFEIGGRIIVVKGTLSADHDTEIRSNIGSSRLSPEGAKVRSNVGLPVIGTFHLTPYGAEGRLILDGRTFILQAGQAALVPKSDFTMRFSPTLTVDPVGGDGSPAGSGFAVVRQSAKARAALVGVLPDGTAFSKGSIVAPILQPDGTPSGDRQLPFFVRLYRDKTGSLDGQLLLSAADEVRAVAGTITNWKKTPQRKDKRFANGFATSMNIVGGKYTQPASGQTPLLDVGDNGLLTSFDRGGVFAPVTTRFTFMGASAKPDADAPNTAHATVKFDSRTGLISGTLRPIKSTLKYRGVVLQTGQTCAGYFLGPSDAGSVQLTLVP
jgi:uncharacterized repeat protein (TIGR03803 family)